MTRRPTSSKLVLVPDGRTVAEGRMALPVRRYRLVRIPAIERAGTNTRAKRDE